MINEVHGLAGSPVAKLTTAALKQVASRPKLGLEISDYLRQALLSGKFERDQHLVLEDLAAQLGVSIMPVREALIGLANEGLVKALPRRGFRATPLADGDLDDIFELHAHIAGILAGRAAMIVSDKQIADLREMHARFENLAAKRLTKAVASELNSVNDDFHRLINKIAKGDRLRWFLKSTSHLIRRDFYQVSSEWISATLKDHPAIIEALQKRDAQLARTLMEAHLKQGNDVGFPVPATSKIILAA